MRRLLVLSILLCGFSISRAQNTISDNRRCQEITPNTIFTSQEVIAPESILLSDSLPGVEIRLLSAKSFMLVGEEQFDKISVCYRVLPKEIQKKFKLTNIGKYDSAAFFRPPDIEEPLFSKREELLDLGEINQGGQISRGITVGNTQDLFVNSSLNLNLEGKISDDLNIRASITDQQIPYQPEGNTQQLQDFDNVFIELYNDKFSVIGGDVVFKNKDSHFLKYFKNVQGGAIGLNMGKSTSGFGISSAKGQFASVTVPVSEGILGPYKVPSVNNDNYVIIIANSEKVYIDGRLMTRGYNNDYIIDYNQAEITFTSNVIITKYTRIRVDYEYSIRDFSRSIINFSHQQQIGKLNILASYYRESDNKNKPLFYDLSEDDKLLLESVGNKTDDAIVSSAQLTPFDPNRVLYEMIDTVDIDGKATTIFKHSTSQTDSLYSISFTDVGAGKGSYVITEYLAQGRIYNWVGEGLGSFAPFRQLAAPGKKEMVDIAARLTTGQFSEVYVESAFSDHDDNLYSNIDNETNQGYAIKTGIKIKDKPISGLGKYKLGAFADLEYLSNNFKAIDRFRRVEFDRDWSYNPADTVAAADLVISSGFAVRRDALNGVNYSISGRQKEGEVKGTQHNIQLNKSFGKLQLNGAAFLMNSVVDKQDASWKKLTTEVFLRTKIQPGYRFLLEQNLVRYLSDSIIASANYFTNHEFFIRNSPDNKNKFEISYAIREDNTPLAGELIQADRSENIRAKYSRQFENGHNINLVFNYRALDDLQSTSDEIESITGRVDWTGDIIRNVFRNELNYSISNARVPAREYVFVQVPTGEGTHTWRDDNMDGIKDLDEFYEAIYFDERNYIKLYVNTTNFLDAYENVFNYRATLKAPVAWRSKPGILGLLSKISNTSSWASHYRTTEDDLGARLIPFISEIDEDQVLSLREALRTTFFVNKANPKFGMSAGYAQFRKKHLYSNGFEARSDKEYNITMRWNLTRVYNLKLNTISAQRVNRSNYLQGRNYDIQEVKISPSFSWQPKPTIRLTTSYLAGVKQSSNSIELPSESVTNEVLGELKMGMAAKYLINITAKYSNLNYNGDELTPLGYEMLQGLRPGDNVSWSVGWQQKLINGLQLNFFYEGRKPNGLNVIHSGRASVSALF